MNRTDVTGASCKVRGAQAVLSLWLESVKPGNGDLEANLIGSILALLDGVPEELEEIHIVLEEAGK
ncbi:hypothetical protein ACNJKD_17660 [Edwardsiella tarda]|uniref:hypothetical protein n=1 Tax=Edwardsiella tarda TaxID=636 RepID=UPI003A85E613